MIRWAATLAALFCGASALAAEVRTNEVVIADAPSWVTTSRVNRIVGDIEHLLEWDIRRVQVRWYKDQAQFEKSHGLGPTVTAYSRKSDNTVNLGPHVTSENFDGVFGHELVHIVVYQKYRDSIPKWLEEGLANYLGKRGTVDYRWLASQKAPADVRELVHPFSGTEDRTRYCYMASQALAEMIASKCSLHDLLQLSLGSGIEKYLPTFCGIRDLTGEFKKWVDSRRLTKL